MISFILKYFSGMALGVDVANDVPNDPLAIDHNSATVDAKFFHAVFLAFLQHAIAAAHLAIVVGEQLHRKAVFIAKRRMAEAIVTRDTVDDRSVAHEFRFKIAEIDRFRRASGCVVFRIKIQHHIALAAQISEPHHFHTGVGQIKIRRRIAHFQHPIAPHNSMAEFYLNYETA